MAAPRAEAWGNRIEGDSSGSFRQSEFFGVDRFREQDGTCHRACLNHTLGLRAAHAGQHNRYGVAEFGKAVARVSENIEAHC